MGANAITAIHKLNLILETALTNSPLSRTSSLLMRPLFQREFQFYWEQNLVTAGVITLFQNDGK